jgi:hypothetical protein
LRLIEVGIRVKKSLYGVALAALATLAVAAPAAAQQSVTERGDPQFLAITGGWFDFNLKDDDAFEGRVEWRGADADRFWIFKPLVGLMATSDGAVYPYAGVLVDLYFGNCIVLTPSFAPGLYFHGGGKDLGHVIEFRSAIELGYRFDDRSRLSIGISHMSNADIGDKNRGEETVYVT